MLEREKSAVTAVVSFDEPDAGVGEELGAGFWSQADEGVVESLQDERGNGNLLDPVGAGSDAVVVVCAGEAAVSRDDVLVEIPQGMNPVEAVGGVESRVELGLVAKVPEQVGEKPACVKAVLRFVHRGGGGNQIHKRRDADDGLEIRRWRGAQLAGQLENQIASHGVADQSEVADKVRAGHFGHDDGDVFGAAGVIDGGRQILAGSATAHIHADNVAAGFPGARRIAQHIRRGGRALEPVNDDHGEAFGADLDGLPVAVTEHVTRWAVRGGGINLDELGFRLGQRILTR